MTKESNRIAAANSMQLTHASIQQKGIGNRKQVLSDQEIIRDTLETTDRESNQPFLNAREQVFRENDDTDSGQHLDLLG